MSLLTDIWGIITFLSLIWVIYDVLFKNKMLRPLMKVFWIVVTLIFGVLGAIAYYLFGSKG